MIQNSIIRIILLQLFILLMAGLLLECKKPVENPSLPVNTADTNFVIGVSGNDIQIITLETPVKITGDYPDHAIYPLDINFYGSDFYFLSVWNDTISGSNIKYSKIDMLDSTIEISSHLYQDSTFQCVTIVNDSVITLDLYNNYSSYECIGSGIETYAGSPEYYGPVIYNKGDKINSSTDWVDHSLTLSSYDKSKQYDVSPGEVVIRSHSILRGIWNGVEMQYILFRVLRENKYYYGWIQISVYDYRIIYIHEYAYEDYPPDP